MAKGKKRRWIGYINKTAMSEFKWSERAEPTLLTPPIWKNKGSSDFIKVCITIEQME